MLLQKKFMLTQEHIKMLAAIADVNVLSKTDVIRALIETAHERSANIYRKAGRWVVTDGPV